MNLKHINHLLNKEKTSQGGGTTSSNLLASIKNLLKNKRVLYLFSVIVLILFCVVLNITFSAFTNTTLKEAANIKVNDMNYSVKINEIPGTIITAPKTSDTTSNLIITSLNEIDSKYEIIYKVCADANCNNIVNKPEGLEVNYSSKTIAPITGTIASDGAKSIRIVVINNTGTTYYIQIGINAGYAHNTLALQNMITGVYNEDDVIIAAYINGEWKTTFPATSNYSATVTCTVNGSAATATGTIAWDGTKWLMNIANATTSKTVCNADFEEIITNENNIIIDMDSNMIPVAYNASGQTIKADKTNVDDSWYNYSQYKWANAVLVSATNREIYKTSAVGTVIPEADILAYYVWIPRYRYTLWNVNANGGITATERQITVHFQLANETVYNGTTDGEELTHPAFWWDKNDDNIREAGEELNGFWVGKFELTGNTTTPTVKPNLASLRGLDVSNMWTTIEKFKKNATYGINASGYDSHMMKNMEWGAVAYLSYSQYGNYGNASTGVETFINPSSSYITGRSGETVSQASTTDTSGTSSTTLYAWNGKVCTSKTLFECTGATQTVYGPSASTTGTIYGVYDMSGGAYEFVMGNMNTSGQDGTRTMNAGSAGNSFGAYTNTTIPKRYYDSYNYGTTHSDAFAFRRGKLGDATKEILTSIIDPGAWNSDRSGFLYYSDQYNPNQWFKRGGVYNNETSAGIWNFTADNGRALTNTSARSAFVMMP